MTSSKLRNALSMIARTAIAGWGRRVLRNYAVRMTNFTVTLHGGVSVVNCRFGKYVTIYESTHIQNCTIGNLSYIQSHSILLNCQIGSFCSIAHDVKIGLGIHPTCEYVSTHPAFYSTLKQCRLSFVNRDSFTEFRETRVGSDVLIGVGCIVLDGVSIGHGAIIGAGSVVTTDIPPYAIAAGVPAKVIKYRFDEAIIASLLRCRWWDKDLRWIREHAPLFHDVRGLIRAIDGSACDQSAMSVPK